MNINQLTNLSFEELHSKYKLFLISQNLSDNTVKTSLSDTFYFWRNGSKELFWDIFTSSDFEHLSREHLTKMLTDKNGNFSDVNVSRYMTHFKKFHVFIGIDENTDINHLELKLTIKVKAKKSKCIDIPRPSIYQIEKYLEKWTTLEDYSLQEDALDKLFIELCPKNENISDILLKSSTLNDFYSTNIFKIYPLARHILSLNIDSRLNIGDVNLVRDIQYVQYEKGIKNFYSFATKYCSHHKPLDYPIYDSYVDLVLRHFRKCDEFSIFQDSDLKDYPKFKNILLDFQSFYGLNDYNLKQIDQYLWLLGKDYFPKDYKKKNL